MSDARGPGGGYETSKRSSRCEERRNDSMFPCFVSSLSDFLFCGVFQGFRSGKGFVHPSLRASFWHAGLTVMWPPLFIQGLLESGRH